ncbi:hypothetical protein HO173_012611 [Letharia columbiana]|uniref:Heme haloperoxidase family profile domain-containing protein n=1 Tax=Letharia columbiana TaxID=112416 RepID=A0A8H6FFA0_9LECA|nr:uncharacterized protein HO173_012611 [Letharia columbiana]KAF6225981.1 hypothetical protein HO173_012611 [Letharia columbiana]
MSQNPSSDETTPLLRKGEYRPPSSTDIRGPCPIINTLANHGYIARDGRNVRAAEMKAAMKHLGVSITLRQLLTSAVYLEHQNDPPTGFWAFVRNPFVYVFRTFALRAKGQIDASGVPCLNLDELDRHGAVEHDVSMSRRDFAQGDNHSKQDDLVDDMLASARDGKDLTVNDWATFRVRRIEQQRRDNPKLNFGSLQDTMGLAETAFLQTTFGDRARGWDVPVSYMAAVFGEERLPVREGWRKRSWWTVGVVELTAQAQALKKVVGRVASKASS